jgi:hypothetical protein
VFSLGDFEISSLLTVLTELDLGGGLGEFVAGLAGGVAALSREFVRKVSCIRVKPERIFDCMDVPLLPDIDVGSLDLVVKILLTRLFKALGFGGFNTAGNG